MQYTQRFTENYQVGPGFFPANYAAGVYQSAWVNMANNQRAVFVLGTGVMSAGATVDVQLWQATDATGANAAVILGKAITPLTQAGGDGNDSVAIELRTEEMNVSDGYNHIAAEITVGVDAVLLTGTFFLGGTNQAPVPVGLWTEIID